MTIPPLEWDDVLPCRTRELIYAESMLLCDVPLEGIEDDGFDWDLYCHPTHYLRRTQNLFRNLLLDGLNSASLSARDRTAFVALTNLQRLPSTLALSNFRLRRQGYRLLYDTVRRLWSSPSPHVVRRWFFVTVLDDLGNALEYAPVVELARLKAKLGKALAATGLHAMGFLEVQAGTNFPQRGHGRSLMFHAHAVGYTDDASFDPDEVAGKLCGRALLTNWLDAPTITLKPITQLGALRRSCAYLFKSPAVGKRLVRDAGTSSGFRLRPAAFRPDLALRLAEALDHLDYADATWAVGDGRTIKTPWLRALRHWHEIALARSRDAHRPSELPWTQLWPALATTRPRHPFAIRQSAALPADLSWSRAAADYLARRQSRQRSSA